MHKLARWHGGKCLSEELRNNQTPLWWECAEGHRSAMSPLNVMHLERTWCSVCRRHHIARLALNARRRKRLTKMET